MTSWRHDLGTAARGYGAAWRRARLEHLRANPWCVLCAAVGRPRVVAGVVDHVTPHRGDVALFWDRTNWQSLCRTCHNTRKAQLERTGRMRGHDETGMPLDPRHHWRAAQADAAPDAPDDGPEAQ